MIFNQKNGIGSDKHHGVTVHSSNLHQVKFDRKFQKWCILSFQDAIFKVSKTIIIFNNLEKNSN